MLDPLNIDAVECNGQGSLLRHLADLGIADVVFMKHRIARNRSIWDPSPPTVIKNCMTYQDLHFKIF